MSAEHLVELAANIGGPVRPKAPPATTSLFCFNCLERAKPNAPRTPLVHGHSCADECDAMVSAVDRCNTPRKMEREVRNGVHVSWRHPCKKAASHVRPA